MIYVLILTQDIKKCKRFLFFYRINPKNSRMFRIGCFLAAAKGPARQKDLVSALVRGENDIVLWSLSPRSVIKRKRAERDISVGLLIGRQPFTVCRSSFSDISGFGISKKTRALIALVLTDRYSASMIASIVRYVSSGSALLVIERPTTM